MVAVSHSLWRKKERNIRNRGPTQEASGDLLSVLSMPTFAEERWSIDTETIKIIMKKKGIKLVTACADGDSNKQKEQVSTMITQESMY